MLPNSRPHYLRGAVRRRKNRNLPRAARALYTSAGNAPFEHIQIAPSHVDESVVRQESPVPFITRPSIQAEAGAVAGPKLTDYLSFSYAPGVSASFAEVAAMPRQRRAFGPAHDSKGGSAEDMSSENPSSSTPDPLKLSVKNSKKKPRIKWSPLDLSTIDALDDSARSPVTAGSSPIFPTVVPYSHSSTTNLQSPCSQVGEGTSYGDQIGGQEAGFQAGPANISERHHPRQKSSLLQESSIIQEEDSPEIKEKIEQLMSRFDEVFDVEEWDPDLPSGRINNSPEPLTAKLQPLAYTTVGSLVKFDAAPKFTAPVRLQREGTGRRNPMPPTQPRAMNNYQMHNQQVNMPNPLGQNPGPQDQPNLRHPARAYGTQQNPSRHPHTLSEMEKETLLQGLGVSKAFVPNNHQETRLRTLGVAMPATRSGHAQLPASNRPTPKDTRETGDHLFDVHELLKEDASGQASLSQGSLAGLEKMQTLQRLAKFENPAREFAKERLSEFAVAKNNDVNNPMSTSSTHNSTYGLAEHQATLQNEFQHFRGGSGQLDYKFKFPPTGREFNPYSGTNPLFSGGTPHLGDSHYPSQQIGNAPNSRPGYPQPLKAGPPGQRQAAHGYNVHQFPVANEMGFGDPEKIYNQFNSNNAMSPQRENFNQSAQHREPVYDQAPMNSIPKKPIPMNWTPMNWTPRDSTSIDPMNSLPMNPLPKNPIPVSNNVVRDTLTAEEALKYFPNGFPRGFQQEYVGRNDTSKYLGETTFPQNGHLKPPKSNAQLKQEYEDKLNKQFYSGLHRVDMTGEDHLRELEAREFERTMGYNPLPPIGPPSLVSRPLVTVEQVKEMSEAECAAPMIDSLFGTLISYADRNAGPNNRALLSKFSQPPPWCIDDGPGGNKSFFGEDWGPAPKRLGRDPRYQGNYDPNSKTWM